jgi:hypothetical protein
MFEPNLAAFVDDIYSNSDVYSCMASTIVGILCLIVYFLLFKFYRKKYTIFLILATMLLTYSFMKFRCICMLDKLRWYHTEGG